MASKRDYYEILGVEKGAESSAIKGAYRKLAIKYHPDKNAGNAEAEGKFKEATEAYEVLSDTTKRQAYDQFGHAGVNNSGGPQFHESAFQGFEDIFGGTGFSDIFGSFFGEGGGGGGRSRSAKGNDLRYNVQVSLEEAFTGIKKEITFEREASCEDCHGSGAAAGSSEKTCSVCHGQGQVRQSSGFFQFARACSRCQGRGTVIEKPCRSCGGQGRRPKKETLNITIPAGIAEGQNIRATGHGNVGQHGSQAGDLYLFISVREHAYFDREDNNLYTRLPISFTQATLGGEIFVKGIDGKRIKLKITAGLQTGSLQRIRSAGMPYVNRESARGDLYVEFVVVTPKKLNAKEQKLLKEFAALHGESSEPTPMRIGRK